MQILMLLRDLDLDHAVKAGPEDYLSFPGNSRYNYLRVAIFVTIFVMI
jgi:hypothetical protein